MANGGAFLIDTKDYARVSKYGWTLHNGYVARKVGARGRRKRIVLHRMLVKVPTGMQRDHRNRDRLDNRQNNIRPCTRAQNCMNAPKRPGQQRYKGVLQARRKSGPDKWAAVMNLGGKTIYLGTYGTEVEAALAYNDAVLKHYGEFANPNIISGIG